MSKTTGSLITILILGIAGLSYLLYQNEQKLNLITDQANKTEIINVTDSLPKDEDVKHTYRLEMYGNQEDSYLLDTYAEKIAIESMNKSCGAKVIPLINNNILQKFFMREFNAGSDRPIQALYKVDLAALTCTKLPLGKAIGDFGSYQFSPEITKLAVSLESNPDEINVVNLESGTITKVAQAKPGETFNAGWGALSNNFVIAWTSEESLKYDTFKDVSYENRTAEGGKPLISTQVIQVQ